MKAIHGLQSFIVRAALGRRALSAFSSFGMIALAILTVALMGLKANATPISYGDKIGATVDYLMITENSGTDPHLFPPNSNAGLFGDPTVSGDSLDFNPQNFFANSDFQAPPFDKTDGHLTFMIKAHAGQAVKNISFQEGGGLSVAGFGTDATNVDVSAIGFVQVHEVDGNPIGVETINFSMPFNFGVGGNGTWRLVSEGTVNGFLWTGSLFMDIKQELINRGVAVNFGATKLSVSIDNSLIANSELLGGAFIDKKDFGGLSVTVNIPEPSSLVLGGIVLLAGLFRRRFV
jgi:hypothetical protein